ncbi:LOW QUALITY PROTEIN: Hypothetical protein PHPALM_8936 [Phytophthora palmivora]|uniref:Reverse transcriptase domain-containing protein n=1 Tax=Phytophthora palmivora TaxID=4796 RepID=A0A2P4Y8M7_9STRA|nr:LOW QUALITY PROTEIN: Hypothetical protein PHPALM_8936 [Phytophthora palmivora]
MRKHYQNLHENGYCLIYNKEDAYWKKESNTWDNYVYTCELQADVDRQLKKHVAPGYGDVSQEMWIAAPERIRQRERRVEPPPILRRKQMVFLPKTNNVDPTLDNSKSLPPWRPITVLGALANRLLLVVKRYVEPGFPISTMQHGFQTERTVIDAALLVTLLTERARDTREQLITVSKDCLKYFDRIPKWCMDLIYRGIGAPEIPGKLMIDLLGPGQIDVRTAFGWLSTGLREFGIGQGSILSILHIACYMDCLQAKLSKCPDPVHIRHHQQGSGIDISSIMFVDDQLDVATTEQGIQARAKITNTFTGKLGTGGVFGASKSFMMYLASSESHSSAVKLNDGLGVPRSLLHLRKGLSILEYIKAGVITGKQLFTNLEEVIGGGTKDSTHVLNTSQFRYIVNSVWVPRMRYRMILSGALTVAALVDTFIRQVARTILKLPYSTPRYVYYDKINGIGLICCEHDANIHRLNELLRIINSPELPVYHVLVERPEAYQINAGLADNPLSIPITPPVQVRTWEAQVIRFAATLVPPLQFAACWTQPPGLLSSRSNDRSLISQTPAELHRVLVAVNWNSTFKLTYVGDICQSLGDQLLTRLELQRKGRWAGAKKAKVDQLYDHWHRQLTLEGTNTLKTPVGCTRISPGAIPYQIRVGIGQWVIAVKLDTTNPSLRIITSSGIEKWGISATIILAQLFPYSGGMNTQEVVMYGTSEYAEAWLTSLRLFVYRSFLPTYLGETTGVIELYYGRQHQ